MHIVHINLSSEFRGGERQTIALVETLAVMSATTGIRQTLIVRKDSRFHLHCSKLDGFDLRPVRPSLLRAALAAVRANLVHVHEGRSTKVGALLSLIGIPFVVTRRVPNCPKDFFLTRWVYSRAANISCVSKNVADVMRDYSGSARVATIYDCARSLVSSPDAIRQKDPDKLTVATIGEVDFDHKGQDLLVEAARELAEQGVGVEFLIVGTGRDEGKLHTMTRGLENFHILGWVNDVSNILNQVDVLLHPARKEGLGSVILEAMTLGKPVVATRVGGIPEIVTHEHDGLLIEPESADSIRKAVARLASDGQLRETLARNARITAMKYSPTAMAEQYLKTYLTIAAVKKLRSRYS